MFEMCFRQRRHLYVVPISQRERERERERADRQTDREPERGREKLVGFETKPALPRHCRGYAKVKMVF